ncbi:MAG: YdbC family protein [Methylocystaceae bacterium]
MKKEYGNEKTLTDKSEVQAMAEIKYEIIKNLLVLSESSRGWKKEINIISWNDRKPKLDIREWGPDHERMGKGVTLSREEVQLLQDWLRDQDVDDLGME